MSLLDEILKIDYDFDDQIEFNNYLSQRISKEDIRVIDQDILEMNSRDLRIKVLSQKIINRGNKGVRAYVWHPRSPSSINRKKLLESLGLWIYHENGKGECQ